MQISINKESGSPATRFKTDRSMGHVSYEEALFSKPRAVEETESMNGALYICTYLYVDGEWELRREIHQSTHPLRLPIGILFNLPYSLSKTTSSSHYDDGAQLEAEPPPDRFHGVIDVISWRCPTPGWLCWCSEISTYFYWLPYTPAAHLSYIILSKRNYSLIRPDPVEQTIEAGCISIVQQESWVRRLCDNDRFIYLYVEPETATAFTFKILSGFHPASWGTTELETATPDFIQEYSLPLSNIQAANYPVLTIRTDNCLYTESEWKPLSQSFLGCCSFSIPEEVRGRGTEKYVELITFKN